MEENRFNNKEELFNSFFSLFYYYLKNYTSCILSDLDEESFLKLAKTWCVNDRSDFYHFGDRFSMYFVEKKIGGKLEDQSEASFIGYCYKNNKFIDFIHFLEVFFEYFRTDEGYSQNDPLENDFYAIPWASLVDTAKYFYLNSNNLNIVYPWFNSKRVKKCLDTYNFLK